ncbi:MAG: hypothetical protein ACK5DE_01070 [Bacteroidota bacterium]|jgi:DNA polymerase III sliding clamp (beta) subunit (PCNA family)
MIYNIATKDLQAVALAMANKDIRYYLNGVLFELDNAGGYRLVGTDGHRMHIVCKRKSQAVDSVIMPSDTVKQLCKLKPQTFEIEIIPGATRQIKIRTSASFITVPEVVGKYPDYRRVMPTKVQQAEVTHYMPEYLADLAKAQKILGTAQQHGYLAQQGSSGVYVSNEKSFYAVIMPLRHNAPEKAEFERGLAKVQA